MGNDVDAQEDEIGYLDSWALYVEENGVEFVPEATEKVVVHPNPLGDRALEYGGRDDLFAIHHAGKIQGPVVADYKGLPLDTQIPTPSGWTSMKNIQVGDHLMGSDGRICRVQAKSAVHYNPCYQIKFDDGSFLVADHEHRWPVVNTQSKRDAVLTTEEIAHLIAERGNRQRCWAVRVAAPLQLPAVVDFPLDPYLLGVWLGDGTRRRGALNLSGPKEPIVKAFGDAGWDLSANPKYPNQWFIRNFQPVLRTLGLADGDKMLPPQYLRGSLEQRLALLQGLMDTDGSWNRGRSQAVFTTTSRSLLRGVHDLVVSLGCRCSTHVHEAHGFGVTTIGMNVFFKPNGFNPFRLVDYKVQAATTNPSDRSWRRLIMSAEPVPTVPTQCIVVDSPDHTFLCGPEMVPTHNTGGKYPTQVTLQLCAYGNGMGFAKYDESGAMLDTYDTLPDWEHAVAIYLKPDGSYEAWKAPVTSATFDAFLDLRRIVNFKKLMEPHEKEAEAAWKAQKNSQ